MCELCWSDWHAAQPHVAPECVCTRFPCRHFWFHSCYHDSFLERQWSENRQRKSRRGVATRRIALVRDAWQLSRDSELLELIHTTWFSQRSIFHEMARARFLWSSKPGVETTQECLSFLD